MASILDQYELDSARAAASVRGSMHGGVQSAPDIMGSNFTIAGRLETETPIFSKKRINFNPPDQITHMAVSNNFLVFSMSSSIILRLDLDHPEQQDEVEIPKAVEDRIHKIFLDPTGRHQIISMDQSMENFYLSRNSKKPKSISKLKGYHINSVGWNWQNANDNTTGSILLGTDRGLLFETELASGEDIRIFSVSLEKYLKQLFNLGKDKVRPITGLDFDRMPTSSTAEYKYYILVTTPGRLYQFVGLVPTNVEPPMFQQLFQAYEATPVQFLELPGNFGYSELHLYYPKFRGQATMFAWMTGPGIYYGDVDVTGSPGPSSVTANAKLMCYPQDSEEKITLPLSFIMTEFHILILFPDRLKVFCLLNEQLIYDDVYIDRFGKLIGLCKDPLRGTIWSYTSQCIFRYKITRETRDIWQVYMDKGKYELAKEYCKDNLSHMDMVLTKEAEYLFNEKRYDESATMYADTLCSFEEVALKFINLDRKDALKSFLSGKLATLRSHDRTQMTMLVTWLTEIYLNQLGELKEQGHDMNEKYDGVQEEFRKFLAQAKVKECVSNNRQVIYDLISSHGDVEDLIFFAMLMKDFERVISHHIQHDNYRNALEVLTKQSHVELFYKFSPLLMQHVPRDTVNAWIGQERSLDPKKLIPALVQYNYQKYKEQGNEAIRYLEFCVEKLSIKDQAIHNYLLSLYARLQPEKLMTYLNIQGLNPENVCYDLKYALRMCSELGQKDACVHIYSVMGLYEEAVDLALSVNVDLAKQQADRPEEDDVELRKKLWRRIARHVVEEKKDVKRAMEFLQECNLLKIEDILPFFHDFVIIDDFKDAIITSLQEYNEHIDSLKKEMDKATASAEEIRKEIQGFRTKYAFVKAQDKCSFCSFPLMTRAFYVFPCQHKFHTDCLIGEVLPNLPNSKRRKVESLQKKLMEPRVQSLLLALHGSILTRETNWKAELDEVIGSECIYCGEFMIKLIDKPFIEEEEMDKAANGWL